VVLNNSEPSRFHRLVLLAALLIHVVTAWQSTGYSSADEHFQIIAFAQTKLGELPVEHLPWEYDAGIRSSLQPWIAVQVFHAAQLVGITDPFNRTFLLRLLTAALALLAVRGFVRATLDQVPVCLKKPFILLSYFLWFLPFLHVRFASESWAGTFLLFGLTSLFRITAERETRRPWDLLWAGIAFGIALLCRPPVGLILISALFWMAVVRKVKWNGIVLVLVGSTAVAIAGFAMDSAFYDRSVFSVWEYVRMGFAGDPDHRFDELPWYYYPPWIVKYAIPPIGVCLLLALALLIWKRPKHLLVWCIVPFFVVHAFIPHKELRFLFPLADLTPLLLVLGFVELRTLVHGNNWSLIGRLALGILVVANLLGLSIVLTSPAGIGRTVLAKSLHAVHPEAGSRITYVIEPLQSWRISLPAFYLPVYMTDSAFTMVHYAGGNLNTDYLVARTSDAQLLHSRNGQQLEVLACTETTWTARLMRWYTWGEGPEPWTLYRVTR